MVILGFCYQRSAIKPDINTIDKSGIFLLSFALLLLMLALNEANSWGITSAYFLVCFSASIALLLLFGVLSAKRQNCAYRYSAF